MKLMKRLYLIGIPFFILILLSSCSKKDVSDSTQDKQVLNIWTFTDEWIKPSKAFEKMHNCKINLTIIPSNDYLVKTTAPLASGVGAPDIFAVECSFAKNFTNEGFFQNLSEPPFNAEKLKDQYTPYVFDLGCDDSGNVVALSNQIAPGGLFYRRSIAKKVFGTDDPKEIAKHFSTMEKLFESAKIIKEKGYKFVPGWKDIYFLINPQQLPWVDKENNLLLPQSKLDYFEEAKTLRDNGYTAKIEEWSPPWFACMYGSIKDADTGKDVEVFGYVLPAWGLSYLLKRSSPNPPAEGEHPVNPTSGDWAVTSGPSPFFSGGTWVGIYHSSKNKDLAWEYVKYIAYKSKYLSDFYKSSEDIPSFINYQKEFEKDCSDPFLDGQNYMKFFVEESKNIKASKVTKYDQDIDFFFKSAVGSYVNGIKTKEEAVKEFKASV
jgi:multiple sugar transport system substrate-binding protein